MPFIMSKVSVFGNEDHAGYDKLTAEITKIFSSTLGISTKNIYVKFDDIANWGVAGAVEFKYLMSLLVANVYERVSLRLRRSR